MRVAFFPYDLIILASATFLIGKVLKLTVLRNRLSQNRGNKLFPFALAYLPISIAFIFLFGELPVKFFFHDDYYNSRFPQLSPQGMEIDEKRVFALAYNIIIWVVCIIIIIINLLKGNRTIKAL